MQSTSITLETIQNDNDAPIRRFLLLFQGIGLILVVALFFKKIFDISDDIFTLCLFVAILILVIFFSIYDMSKRDAIPTGTLTIGSEQIMYWPQGVNAQCFKWEEIRVVQYFYHSYNGESINGRYYSKGDKNYIIIQCRNGHNVKVNFHLERKQVLSIEEILKQSCQINNVRFYRRKKA